MRVIAGQFRSRPLRSLRGLDIRPTSDRLRGSLFDVLTAGNPQALQGSLWLDLFAGTGAVGIEAVSRGAAMVYFVESSKRAAHLITANVKSLGISDGFRVWQQPALQAIRELDHQQVKPHFIFLDPPYRSKHAYSEILEYLGNAELAQRSLVIAEHERKFDPGEVFGFLRRIRKFGQGDTSLSFYRPE